MSKSQTEIARRLGGTVASFLQSQLGEKAASVRAVLAANTLTVHATDCLAPAESKLIQSKNDWKLLQDFKTRQFESVQPLLRRELEALTGCQVSNLVTAVGKDGLRVEVITFNEDVAKKF